MYADDAHVRMNAVQYAVALTGSHMRILIRHVGAWRGRGIPMDRRPKYTYRDRSFAPHPHLSSSAVTRRLSELHSPLTSARSG